jgi:hypothetical protein
VVAAGKFHVVGNTEVIQVLSRYFQASKSVSTFILVDTTQHPKVTCLFSFDDTLWRRSDRVTEAFAV